MHKLAAGSDGCLGGRAGPGLGRYGVAVVPGMAQGRVCRRSRVGLGREPRLARLVLAAGLAWGVIGGLAAPTRADCLPGGRTEVPLAGRKGLVVTFVHGDVTGLSVVVDSPGQPLLWRGEPFAGLTLSLPGPGAAVDDRLILTITPERPDCLVRIERF